MSSRYRFCPLCASPLEARASELGGEARDAHTGAASGLEALFEDVPRARDRSPRRPLVLPEPDLQPARAGRCIAGIHR